MSKIEQLSSEHTARFKEYVDRWIAIGTCTAPADRAAAEIAIGEIYRSAGLKEPRSIIWCGSPLSQSIAYAILRRIQDSVGDNIGESVVDSVVASVWKSVRDSVVASVGESVGKSIYGQHYAGYLSFYDFFREVVGLTEETEKIAGMIHLAKSAGWMLPFKDMCFVCERPRILHLDERGRTHSVTGPAIEYPDGWQIFAVHGIIIDRRIVMCPESITVEQIEKEENVEKRRVMMEIYGNSRYLRDSNATLIDESSHGKLWRKNQEEDEALCMVEVKNSSAEPDGTRKTYFLRVPPHVSSASEAVAWTFGLRKGQYKPTVET